MNGAELLYIYIIIFSDLKYLQIIHLFFFVETEVMLLLNYINFYQLNQLQKLLLHSLHSIFSFLTFPYPTLFAIFLYPKYLCALFLILILFKIFFLKN